jgi:hypothetical protein
MHDVMMHTHANFEVEQNLCERKDKSTYEYVRKINLSRARHGARLVTRDKHGPADVQEFFQSSFVSFPKAFLFVLKFCS